MSHSICYRQWYKPTQLIALFALFFLLTACGGGDSSNSQGAATPTAVPVNVFGTAANHVHSMLALPSHTLLLATHYGFFRSEDGGTTWQKTAAGANQPMDGLMTYSLSVSPLNSQRLFVLSQHVTRTDKGTPGLYTSADQGRTWTLSVDAASLTSTTIYLAAAGNDTPDEVYIYLRELGSLGLRVSLDDGKHFSTTGMLPFGEIQGLQVISGTPGLLLAYGTEGIARSTDGGVHWQVSKGISGAIFDIAALDAHDPIYASGDQGVLVSLDGGVSFSSVYTQSPYNALTISPVKPQVVYGKTGSGVFRSTDGGHSWTALPHINGNLQSLAINPNSASQVYLALNYPTEVYQLSTDGTGWVSLTPQA